MFDSQPKFVFLTGKGGVGKTTIAAAVAVELAARGHEVLLPTTDPAAHLNETLMGDVPGLTVSRIDPEEATRTYRDHIMATRGKTLDDKGRATLEEDLRSPCTEEIALIQALSKVIRETSRHFVVMDTAPTGHPLLAARAATEAPEIARVRDDLAARHAAVPIQAEDPVGATRLRAVTGTTLASAAE